MSKRGTKSEITFFHESRHTSLKDGVKITDEEIIIDGPRGLTIKYFHNENGVKTRIAINGKSGSYTVATLEGDNMTRTELHSAEELKKFIKSEERLKFAKEYAKNASGGAHMGRPKRTKKGSKASKGRKGSKKRSKKTSRK